MYCTLAQLKAALRITDTTDDTLLTASLMAAGEAIDNFCERSFQGAGSAARLFAPTDSTVLQIDDAVSITTVVASTAADGTWDQTWAATDWQAEPLNQRLRGGWYPVTRLRAVAGKHWVTASGEATVKITASWGWSTPPAAVSEACKVTAMRLFKRLDSPLGVAGWGDMGVFRVGKGLDPDVRQLISAYRRGHGVA